MRLPTVLSLLFVAIPSALLAAQEGGEPEILLHFDGGGPSVRLGETIAFGGDINADGTPDILIGAEFADTLGFSRNGMVLLCSGLTGAQLYQFNGSANFENFGSALTSPGDMNADGFDDILVGSPGADPLAFTDAGEIDIFSGADGSLLLHRDGSADQGRLGAAVAAVGDIDFDGTPDFLVAEPGRNSNAGRIYIYSGLSTTILLQLDGNLGDEFGTAVSSAADFDADGTPDFIVGSPYADIGAFVDNGCAQVFSGASGLLLMQFQGLAAQDHFGQSLSGGLLVDLDSTPDIIVGAPNHNPGGVPSAGAATVFSGATGATLYQVHGVALADNFGGSVALAGDVDGDGFGDFIVGARLLDAGGLFDSGSAFLFSGRSGALLFRADGATTQDNLGATVIGGVDINGDLYPDIAYATPFADTAASLAGAVDVERIVPALALSALTLSNSSGGSTDFFINFPLSEAGLSYILLASRSGIGPTNYRGASIPLTVDSIFQIMAAGGPLQFSASTGTLDAFGDATANLNLLPGEAAALVGATLRFSAVSHMLQSPRHISNAATFLILP